MGWVQTIIIIVNTIPISISGIGVREGGLIFLLKPYGVSGAEAVALSFLVFARNVAISLIGGVLRSGNFYPEHFQTNNKMDRLSCLLNPVKLIPSIAGKRRQRKFLFESQ